MSVAQGRIDVQFAVRADEPILGLLRTADYVSVSDINTDARGIRWITFSVRLADSSEQIRLSVQTYWDQAFVITEPTN